MPGQTFEDTVSRVRAFRDERDWARFHNPKDLAASISIEAAELLELFQWSGTDTSAVGREQELADELADVLIYCMYLADAMGVEVSDIITCKLEKNKVKYPVESSRGVAKGR